MKRRQFIGTVGAGALVGTGLTACGQQGEQQQQGGSKSGRGKTREWRMVTTWPKNFPGLGTGANYLAELITTLTGGRINVKVYGAGELVDAFGIFDLVSDGGAELGHGAAYYWKGKSRAAQFFSAVPFGLTAQEINSWFYHGGGMELWKEVYEPFGLYPMAAGNTGVQMGGWFNTEINSVDDLEGLKMRIPGLGGEVLKRAGGTPVSLPGGEIFTSLETGAIDATEWVGPYNDLAFGLYKAAKHYYYPGWHEPGTCLECFVNRNALDELPQELREIVLHAGRVANQDMLAEFTARNNKALQTLVEEHDVDLRKFPDDVLKRLRELSDEVVGEIAEADEQSRKVYESFVKFRDDVQAWHDISERAYLNARASGSVTG